MKTSLNLAQFLGCAAARDGPDVVGTRSCRGPCRWRLTVSNKLVFFDSAARARLRVPCRSLVCKRAKLFSH